jgi:DNA-binding LacI/PurR family transcriptional regulator
MATPASPPTLEMVAALAGVSRSTVSRVVNSPSRVPARVVEAVRIAIDELGYVPNSAARSLASHRSRAIALIIPEDTARFFADPYYAAVIPGIAKYLSGTEYTLTMVIASEVEPEKTRRYLLSGNVDGALVLSHHTDDVTYVEMAQTLPIVFAGRPPGSEDPRTVMVDIDNVGAAELATRYLIDHGRRRLATITGPLNMASALDRLEGWRRAAAAAGLETTLIENAEWSDQAGADAMRRILERGIPFDGLFAASAQIATGAMDVLRERGIAVPGDVAITTIDNDHFAQSAHPPLTTIEQLTLTHGATLAETLVRLIAGEDVAHRRVMPTTLIERESV